MAHATTGEILEPPGTYHPWYSLQPLIDAGEWAATPGPFFKKHLDANDGAPIFKAHPGVRIIAITDHASGKWFFEQPDTVLDRQSAPQQVWATRCRSSCGPATEPVLRGHLHEVKNNGLGEESTRLRKGEEA